MAKQLNYKITARGIGIVVIIKVEVHNTTCIQIYRYLRLSDVVTNILIPKELGKRTEI